MNNRGFTLIELMVAGSISIVVVMGGFLALTSTQAAAAKQQEADEIVSQARIAMEVMARDLRTAGDSMNLLSTKCLGAAGYANSPWRCPAVLDPHPWRVTVGRNAWVDTDANGTRFSSGDTAPPARLFEEDPENAVTFRFVPYSTWETPKEVKAGNGAKRNAVLGRIERVQNPFSFKLGAGGAAQAPVVSVLLDNVLLDNQMRVNPADTTQIDHRYDYALFLYQLITRNGELDGDAGLVERTTTASNWFLTPPMRFFATSVPTGYPTDVTASPYSSSKYTTEIVGLKADGTASSALVKGTLYGTATGDVTTTSLDPTDPKSALRYLLDRNRIRTVHVGFKVAATRERTDVRDGLDLDGNPANGTARVYEFETTVELKPLSRFLTDG